MSRLLRLDPKCITAIQCFPQVLRYLATMLSTEIVDNSFPKSGSLFASTGMTMNRIIKYAIVRFNLIEKEEGMMRFIIGLLCLSLAATSFADNTAETVKIEGLNSSPPSTSTPTNPTPAGAPPTSSNQVTPMGGNAPATAGESSGAGASSDAGTPPAGPQANVSPSSSMQAAAANFKKEYNTCQEVLSKLGTNVTSKTLAAMSQTAGGKYFTEIDSYTWKNITSPNFFIGFSKDDGTIGITRPAPSADEIKQLPADQQKFFLALQNNTLTLDMARMIFNDQGTFLGKIYFISFQNQFRLEVYTDSTGTITEKVCRPINKPNQ